MSVDVGRRRLASLRQNHTTATERATPTTVLEAMPAMAPVESRSRDVVEEAVAEETVVKEAVAVIAAFEEVFPQVDDAIS